MSELVAKFEKRFPAGMVVRGDLQCRTEGFSITVLLGESGSGKTTMLRCLAGLETPDRGLIRFGEKTWFRSETRECLSPGERGIGYLSQDYALFPHRTVAQNIAYGLRRSSKSERARRTSEMLDLFDLRDVAGRLPRGISGGEQQRAALARALVRQPRLLLLDEPLAALDAPLRERLRGELRRLLAASETPVFLVTHDRLDAISLADEVVVIQGGRVRQTGPVREVFGEPADREVARIVGVETVEPGEILSREGGLAKVAVGSSELLAVAPESPGRDVYVLIRGEEVALEKAAGGRTSARNRMAGRVRALVAEGPLVRIHLDCGFPLTALVTRPACEELALSVEDHVIAVVKVPAVRLIPRA